MLALDATSTYVVSQVEGRPAYGGTPSDASVIHLIAELKTRGLKITLYPFVMMDIPAGNTLPDPWTGAAAQAAYPWRGRITCHPAPGQPGSPDGTAAAATQVDAFFGIGDPGGWNYRRLILHYAQLAANAGGVDAFLVGSELRSLTRVRSASGVYPAVTRLVELADEVKTILGSGTVVTYGADWTEYGAHVVDEDADEVRFPLDALWASAAIDAVGIDYYAPLADWRDGATHLDRQVADSIYDPAYLAGNLRGGEGYDFFYADDAARNAQTRTPITDGLGKPWIFRAKDLWNWWSNAHYERVGGVELLSPTDWVPQGKPIWLTEFGCGAVDKGANQPSTFPDPKSSEGGVPYFSNGRRDDLIQRRAIEAVLTTFDPAHGATTITNPISSVYGERMVEPSTIHLWAWDARPYPVFPAATEVWGDAAKLGGRPLAYRTARLGAARRPGRHHPEGRRHHRRRLRRAQGQRRRLCDRAADGAARGDRAVGARLCLRRLRGRGHAVVAPAWRGCGGGNFRGRPRAARRPRPGAACARARNRAAARGLGLVHRLRPRLSAERGHVAAAGRWRRARKPCRPRGGDT